MNRREYLRWMAASVAAWGTSMELVAESVDVPLCDIIPLTPKDEIIEQVNRFRPLSGHVLPTGLRERLGATHAGGKYHLTSEPFLLEGSRKLSEFGLGALKLWFDTYADNYPFSSDWSGLARNDRLVDIARHPYYEEAFEFPFSTFALEITHFAGARPFDAPKNDYSEYEQQFEELTAYLYDRYENRPVTFILQNWEGDWLFFGKFVQKWDQKMLDDLPRRIDCFTRWFQARQRGVEKARKKAIQNGAPQCRVLHAVEVNQVLACLRGTPTLTEKVLPHITPDLVSWSCYDGLANVTDTWHGIELIRYFMKSSGFLPKPTVMIGEVGIPENKHSKEAIVDFWDRTLGVFFALDIPWIFQWEIYCNELSVDAQKKNPPPNGVYPSDDLNGFWLFRPDGSLSHSGQFFADLLKNCEVTGSDN